MTLGGLYPGFSDLREELSGSSAEGFLDLPSFLQKCSTMWIPNFRENRERIIFLLSIFDVKSMISPSRPFPLASFKRSAFSALFPADGKLPNLGSAKTRRLNPSFVLSPHPYRGYLFPLGIAESSTDTRRLP
jgi:hypothetical protein